MTAQANAAQIGSSLPFGRGDLGAILVDFDNLLPPSIEYDASLAKHKIMRCVEAALERSPQLAFMQVRLYGGWRSDGLLSRRGSQVAAMLPQVDPFPAQIGGSPMLRGSLELATALVGRPGLEFDDTHRRRAGAPRLRLSASPLPEGCMESTDACPAHILKQFTRGPGRLCPVASCAVTSASAFVAFEQKMVDTLLTCDLLEFALDESVKHVSVVSADTDFLPPILMASRRSGAALQMLVPKAGWSPGSRQVLEDHGVAVIEVEGPDGTR